MDAESENGWIGSLLTGATALVTFVGAVIGVLVGLDRLGVMAWDGSAEATPADDGELAVTALEVDVNPAGHTGKCPVNFEFLAEIVVEGAPGTVSYRWVRSDGEEGPVQTLDVHHPETFEVETTWMLGEPGWSGDGTYWQQLELLEPVRRASKRASFTLRCP